MSNIFITNIDGSGTYAVPASDAALAAATSGLDTLVGGVANLAYDRLLAWVEDQGGPNGAEGVRTLNAVVEKFTYNSELCPDETEIDTMTAAIEAALEADANISTIGVQQVSIMDPGQNFFWERDAGGFLYPAPSTDDIVVGPDSAPTGKWFEDGDMVLGAAAMSGGAEKMRIVGSSRIEGEALLTEFATAPISGPAATEGFFWVKNDTPSSPYFTDGAGVDHRLATTASLPSLPGVQQVLFVDKTSAGYVADGSMGLPYNSIGAAITAATALTPTATNRILIIIYPGVYDEAITTADSYVYFAGYDPLTTIIRQSSGTSPPLTIQDGYIGFRNLTFEVTASHTGYILNMATILTSTPVVFESCHFLGTAGAANNFVRIANAIDPTFYDCVFAHGDDTAQIYYTTSGNPARQEFFDCSFTGRVTHQNSDPLTTFDCYNCNFTTGSTSTSNGAMVISYTNAGGMRFLGCRFENTSTTGNAVYGPLNTAVFTDCEFIGGSSTGYDIRHSNLSRLTAFGCTFTRGLYYLVIPDNNRLYAGTGPLPVPFHQTLYDCVRSMNSNTASTDFHIDLLEDQTLAAQLPGLGSSRAVTVDGQDLYTIDRAGARVLQTSSVWKFSRVQIKGDIYGAAGDVYFRNSRLEGRLLVQSDTVARAYDSEFVGTSAYNNPLYIASATCFAYFSGCYLKGYTGASAVYYASDGTGTTHDMDSLYMESTVCMHGDLGTNNPFSGQGVGTTPPVNLYYAHTCTFNQEPALADPTYLRNEIDPGQRKNTIDPDGDYTWLPAW